MIPCCLLLSPHLIFIFEPGELFIETTVERTDFIDFLSFAVCCQNCELFHLKSINYLAGIQNVYFYSEPYFPYTITNRSWIEKKNTSRLSSVNTHIQSIQIPNKNLLKFICRSSIKCSLSCRHTGFQ